MPLYLLLVLLPAFQAASVEDTARAINSTGLWSKYNLIVKPSLSPRPGSKVAVVVTSTAAPAARWGEEEDEESYGPDIHDDRHEVEDDEEEDSEEDEEEEEDEQSFVPHTTQRSKGDGSKKKKKKKKPAHKIGKGTKGGLKGYKGLKKLKKYMFPLLIAYKLKFFTLIPLLLGGLTLIVATTGFAGFFFALFAVGVGLKKD